MSRAAWACAVPRASIRAVSSYCPWARRFIPLRRCSIPANDMTTDIITTHFDYHSIDHNLLKLDILGHDDPTMIRMLEDLTGLDAKTIPLDDKEVMSLFPEHRCSGNHAG